LSVQPAGAIPGGASPTWTAARADLFSHMVAARDLDNQRFTPLTLLWHG
jgi:hypothetical protein